MAIRYISFDMDGTLIDFNFNNAFYNQKIPELYAKKHGVSFDEAKRHVEGEYNSMSQEDLDWYRPDYWAKLFRLGDAREIMMGLRNHINFYPDSLPVIKALGKKYGLVMITNMTQDMLGIKLGVNGLGKLFTKSCIASVTNFHSVIGKFIT